MVTEAKDSYDVMLLPGDGIGPEITAATVNALEPLQSLFKLNFKEVCMSVLQHPRMAGHALVLFCFTNRWVCLVSPSWSRAEQGTEVCKYILDCV